MARSKLISLREIPHRHKLLFIGIGAVLLVLLGAGAAIILLLSGAYTTAATKQHFAITYQILDAGLHYSVRSAAADIQVPDLRRSEMILQGASCYREHCAQCHDTPGGSRDDAGKGMLPSPSSLVQSAREWPAAHLYYVTKKGVRMTGMPAWEFRISEQGLWSTVAFLKQLPLIEQTHYQRLAADTAGQECPRSTELTQPYSREYAQTVLRQYACDNCHRMEDVVGPDTHVGPSLEQWRHRKYIAGVLPNTRENLVRWIVAPQEVSPQTMMPDMGVPEAHAQVMAAYLLASQ